MEFNVFMKDKPVTRVEEYFHSVSSLQFLLPEFQQYILNFVFIPFFRALGVSIANLLAYVFLVVMNNVIFVKITISDKARKMENVSINF